MEAPQSIGENNPPDLFTFTGDWETYEESLYKIFQDTICDAGLTFHGQRIGIRRVPEHKDKYFVFWHLTSEGELEEERTPDLRRCERLSWVNWIIVNCGRHSGISFWENKRGSETHVVIWCEQREYAVVLAKRNGYYLLKTAYCVNEKRANSFRKERQLSQKKNS